MPKKLPHMIIRYEIKELDNVDYSSSDFLKLYRKKEIVTFSDKISKNQLLTSDVIIDILNGKFVKNRLSNIKQEDLLEYYMKKYSNNIVEYVRNFFIENQDYWNNMVESAKRIEEKILNDNQ